MRIPRKSKKVVAKPQYLGDDPAQFVWSNRTHRSVSEAFRDAEYACSITKFKSDWQLSLEFLCGAVMGFLTVLTWFSLPVLLLVWLTR